MFSSQSAQHQKNLFVATIICVFAVVITLVVLNLSLGLVVYYLDPSVSILWNGYSPIFLLLVSSIMLSSVIYDIYVFRKGGHSLAKQMNARFLKQNECAPEEIAVLELNQKLADRFNISPPSVYVLPHEIGVNALTAGNKPNDTVIIVTWGALQNLDELELYGLLSFAFNQILTGEMRQNIRLKVLFSALTSFNQLGSRIARHGFKPYDRRTPYKLETVLVALGGIIWLMGSLGLLISRLIKFITLSGRTLKNDYQTHELIANDKNLQTLLRIYVHHAGSQIHSAYSESIAHMCFANSLSPQSWLNIHPSIEHRIYSLNPSILQELQFENLKRLRSQRFFNIFRPFSEFVSLEVQMTWTPPDPLPLLRLSPITFTSKDEIKPLSLDIRKNLKRPEIINRALKTNTGAKEVLVAILMIRQYREFIPQDALVSRAIVDALLAIDGRLHIQIFYDACHCLQKMPSSTSRQFLTKLALIIQADGEIGLLDGLLLEYIKDHLNLLPPHMPTAYDEALPEIIRLIDMLLHVQQFNSSNQLAVRQKVIQQVIPTKDWGKYLKISDEPINISYILHHLSGLLLRDRLKLLVVAEQCLWTDHVITQEELDVLELLYWRLGFENKTIVKQIQKQNNIVIA